MRASYRVCTLFLHFLRLLYAISCIVGCDSSKVKFTLQLRHNERDGVSNHRRLDCLLNRLFICRSKKTSKLRIIGLCEGNSPVTDETRKMFPFDNVIMLYIAMASATIIMTMQGKQITGGFQITASTQLCKLIENANISLDPYLSCFLK